MSTHAGALLITALAYTLARKHAASDRLTFGTGKLGDLAAFTSAVVLVMIALLIGYESISRFIDPVPIAFAEAIPIAVVGFGVNLLTAFLLREDREHRPGHEHARGSAKRSTGHVTNAITATTIFARRSCMLRPMRPCPPWSSSPW